MKIKYSDIIKKQPIINIGTIGHVASGKSSITRQITGIKTQRFSKEKIKNITIEIGYGNAKIFMDKHNNYHTTNSNINELKDNDGEQMKLIKHISIVDCPGHESYMSNMINGSAVMDACILVIASNEIIPQSQAVEHLKAVEILNIDNYIILQNKLDLIKKEDNNNKLNKIKKFVKGTKAENSVIIPTSIQNNINIDKILNSIINLPSINRQINIQPKMIIIRSFDINKCNKNYKNLKGGVIGGSLIQGHLKINDIVELRPGFIIKQNDKTYYKPIISKIISLKSDNRELEYAFPGGLIGIGLQLDPSLTKNNNMVGQILGHIGKLPEVSIGLKLEYNYIERKNTKIKFIKKEKIIICVNSMRINGEIHHLKKKKMTISLENPICIESNEKIVILKRILGKWKVNAYGLIYETLNCEKIDLDKNYNKLLNSNKIEKIEIINDINYEKKEEVTYNEMLKNVLFRENFNFKLNIKIPNVRYKFPITNFINFIEILNNLKLSDKINVNYKNLMINFFKKELSCNIEEGSTNNINLRGKFSQKNITSIISKFAKFHLTCLSCNTPKTYLNKIDKIIYRNCLICNSVSSI